jgi:hypothetical protein
MENDIFIHPKPYHSWIFNPDGTWSPPVEHPNDENTYIWNEETISWDLVTTS